MNLRVKLRILALLTSVMSVTGLATTSVSATTTEIMGGPGGRAFTLRCPDGQALVGFRARAGASVDAVALICASITNGRTSSQFQRPGGFVGGGGGSFQEKYCPPGKPVTAIGLAHTRGGGLERQFVNTIDLQCDRAPSGVCISSGEGCGPVASRTEFVGYGYRGVNYKYDGINCPANEVAVGVIGRSVNLIDAMGLICEAPIVNTNRHSTRETAAKISEAARRARGEPVEPGINRYGGDYKRINLPNGNPAQCRAACQGDGNCLSCSFVKAGIQGPTAVCWLKSTIPTASRNDCCTSGVLRHAPVADPRVNYGSSAPPSCPPGNTGTPPNCYPNLR